MAVDYQDLARRHPVQALKLWYALHRFPWLLRTTRSIRLFAESAAERLGGIGEVVRVLTEECGCPMECLPRELQQCPPSGTVSPQALAQFEEMCQVHTWPGRAKQFEAVANLNSDDDDQMLALVGLMRTESGECRRLDHRPPPRRPTPKRLQVLRTSVRAVQRVAEQLTLGRGYVEQTEEATVVQQLAEGRRQSREARRRRIPLVPPAAAAGVGALRLQVPWSRSGAGVWFSHLDFWINEHAAQAAALLVDYADGTGDERVGRCPHCDRAWAEVVVRAGAPAERCPLCRSLTLRFEDRHLWRKGSEWFVRYGGMRYWVTAPDGFDLGSYRHRDKYVEVRPRQVRTRDRGNRIDLVIVRIEPEIPS